MTNRSTELRKLLASIRQSAEDPSRNAYLGRCCWDDAAVHNNWDACRQRLEDIRDTIDGFVFEDDEALS